MPHAITFSYHEVPLDDGWCATVLSSNSETTMIVNITTGLSDQEWKSFCKQLLKKPSALAGFASLKTSKDGQVIQATIADGVQVVCKQSRTRGVFRRIVAKLYRSSERQQFDIARKLLGCGISTALPYALLHKKIVSEGWLITQYLENSIDLDQVALAELPRMRGAKQRLAKNTLISELADLISKLHKHHIYHRDFKASNILATGLNGENLDVKVWLIDTEGIQFDINSQAKDDRSLIRLIASLLDYRSVTRTDLARLLRQLEVIDAAEQCQWKPQLRELLQQASEYNERSRNRKSHKLDGYQ